ncbi:MAG: GAF domain-containing protein [Anaerolineales bacterium]|nr:GAF domain-containing protein [Anaerolineales bacterium]
MHRGTIAYRVGKYQEAIQSHTAALTLAQELGSQNQLISALNNLASSHLENQEVEKAVEYYEQAFQLNRRVGNQIFHISLLINMGICHALLHDYALSQSLTKQAMTLAETVGNQINVAIAAESLGHTACLLGHFAEGLQYAQFGLGILEKIAKSNAYLMGDIWQVMAENLFYLNRLDEAEEAHQAALTYRSEGAIERRIQTEAGLAHTVLAKGEPERALTYLQSVLTFLESSDAPNFSHLFLYLVCYDVLNGNGLPEAKPYLQTAYRLLQAEAEKIAPDESRKIFWETHVVHREIVRLYEALPVGKETADFSFGTTADVAANDAAARAAEAILDEALKGAVETAEPALERLRGEALLTRLLAVSRRMAETRTVQPLLSYAIDEVLQLVGAERGYIVLLRPDGALDYRVRRRRDGSEIRSGDPVSYSILNEVIRTRQPLVVRNALLDPRFGAAHSVVAMRLRSVMCAPLITKDAIIGAIYVENRSRSGRFSEEDLAPLAFFSNQAAVAIENANLNENLESLVEERTRELAQAKEVAEIANLAKTTFLSNMSHELRTPLNAVLNFAGFVMDGFFGDVNTEQENALQQVLDSGEHLLSLINDVLDLNKIEAGMMNLVFEEVDLAKIMQHLLSTGKGLVKDKPIVITADLAADLPLIQADRRRLRQIFLNLMSNAAKYTLEGTIHVQAHRLAQMVEVSIQDSGIGIAPEDYPLIFQTYRQARRNPDNVMSTGLGLPITRQLVELHGGRIWFESKSGVGTTFYVQMPIKRGE